MYYLFNVKIKIQINAVVHDLIQQCLRNKTYLLSLGYYPCKTNESKTEIIGGLPFGLMSVCLLK